MRRQYKADPVVEVKPFPGRMKPLPSPMPRYGEVDMSKPVGPAHSPVIYNSFSELASPGDIYINPYKTELVYILTSKKGWQSIDYDPADFG